MALGCVYIQGMARACLEGNVLKVTPSSPDDKWLQTDPADLPGVEQTEGCQRCSEAMRGHSMPGIFQSVSTVLSHGHRAVQHLYQALGARARDAATVSWDLGKVTRCSLLCINSPERHT